MKLNEELNKIMEERFCKDTVISLVTTSQGIPYVRNVNAYYENGAFYSIAHALLSDCFDARIVDKCRNE